MKEEMEGAEKGEKEGRDERRKSVLVAFSSE